MEIKQPVIIEVTSNAEMLTKKFVKLNKAAEKAIKAINELAAKTKELQDLQVIVHVEKIKESKFKSFIRKLFKK